MAELINFYKVMDKKHLPHQDNPNKKKHNITVPSRILVVGGSGSMKTNAVLNILNQMSNTFQEIMVFCRDKDEPLYNHLADKVGDAVKFWEIDPDASNKVKQFPQPKEIGKDKQRLVIFDDLCLLSKVKQRPICEFFTTGRKFNMTCIYITQSYYEAPKTIRSQCNYIILKKISGNKDLKLILSEYQLNSDLNEMIQIYKYCVQDQISFLLIDLQTNDDKKIFRRNFQVLELLK